MSILPNLVSEDASYDSDIRSSKYAVDESLTVQQPYNVSVPSQEGELFMFIVYGETGYSIEVSRVDAKSTIEFSDSHALRNFVASPTDMRSLPQNLGNALLVRMTNTPLSDLASGIVQPLP